MDSNISAKGQTGKYKVQKSYKLIPKIQSGSSGQGSSLIHPASKRKEDGGSSNNNSVPDYTDVLDDSKTILNHILYRGILPRQA